MELHGALEQDICVFFGRYWCGKVGIVAFFFVNLCCDGCFWLIKHDPFGRIGFLALQQNAPFLYQNNKEL
ncbi:MAG: hypothetical protein ABIO19_11030 [Burkholderiaceae bacterium]